MTRFGAALSSCLLMILLSSTPSAGQEAAGGGEEAGQLAFNNACRTCHTVKEGDNRLGPNLHAIIGRKAGSLPGYSFSSPLAQSGIVWDEANLDRFIENPDVGRSRQQHEALYGHHQPRRARQDCRLSEGAGRVGRFAAGAAAVSR